MNYLWVGAGLVTGGAVTVAAAFFGPDIVWRIQRRRHQRAVRIEFGGKRLG